jgi:hypothetical protein
MPISTNFNVNPYYDDFSDDKKFLRLLYKPGYAVQARELTQMQTLLQKQIERFGNHIFKNGSVVTGGQVFLQDVTYMNLDSQYVTTDIVAADFVDKIILSADDSKRGQVVKVYDTTANTPHTLLVKQIYGNTFISGDSIKTVEGGGDAFANRANVSASGVGTGQIFSVNEGVYYYEGFFVKVDAQTIATSVYNNTTANARIGFEVTEDIIESVDDTSLLDPAQGASNFQAPGSDRFKINLTLTTRTLDSIDLTKFIELAQVKDGVLQKVVRTPLYAELEETLARRTFDESGDYVVNPFLLTLESNSSNTANLNVTLSPGKAYVKGYEYQTISPTTIVIPKPRDTIPVSLKRISADYGSFIYTTNHYGLIPVDTLGTMDIHCVRNNSIMTANTAIYNNTKIGTARVKSIAFDATAASQSDANTYIYKTYLVDVNVGSIVVTATGTLNTSFVQLASATAGNLSNVNDAYKGAKLRIISGPGSGEYPRTITNYYAGTKQVSITPPFATAPTSASVCSIDFEIKDAESLVELGTGTNFTSAINIYDFSKDLSSTYQNVFITEKGSEPLLIKLGEDFVSQNTIDNFSYEYQKFLTGITVGSTTTGVVDLAGYLGSGESFSTTSASSTSTKQENLIVMTKSTNGIYVPNQIVAAANLSMSGTVLTFSSSYTGDVDMLITVTSSANALKKDYIPAAVTVQDYGTANNIFGNNAVYVINHQGQTQIHEVGMVNRIPGIPQSLFVSDVVSINAIFDFRGSTISQANLPSAANVTSRYLLDNGQRDSYYDHASIILKPGETAPQGPLLIRYNRYRVTGNTPGYFTVDSYLSGHNNSYPEVTYENIPVYSSVSSDRSSFALRDYFDFRPVRRDASANDYALANTKTFSTSNGQRIPQNGTDITSSFENYLPRIDKIVLDTSRNFSIIRGVSSVNPVEPQDKEDSMTLYVLRYPPYVDSPRLISVKPIRNQRYTMKDIGVIEKRLENLEYYTSLSLLEFDTATKQDFSILDSANLPRFKNGFIVDAFNGTSVSNVLSYDFKASIDRRQKLLRPTFNLSSHLLTYSSSETTAVSGGDPNVKRRGPIFTVDYEEVPYVTQPLASRSVNINPFNVIDFLGRVQLDPVSDVWYDEIRQPELTVDISGDRAAWQLLVEGAAQTEWNSWQTTWSSTSTRDIEEVDPKAWKTTSAVKTKNGTLVTQQQNIDTLTVTTQQQARTGVKSTVTLDTITKSLGDRVVDVSIIPFMRDVNILFVGDDFYPSTQLYAFFDNIDVNTYIARANKIVFKNNNLQYQTQVGNPEFITFKNNITGTSNGTGVIVKTSNNVGFFVSAEATASWNVKPTGATMSIIGQTTSQNNVIQYYEHYTGNAQTGSTSSTIKLNLMADGANNTTAAQLQGEPIRIVTGTGVGQSSTITNYDPTTLVATVSPSWTVTPDITSRYTIGRLTTTDAGSTAGIFFLPASVFRVGEKLFRLIDDSSGNIESSSTNGDARFFAQGLLQTKQESSIIATVPAGIQRSSVSDTRTVQSTSMGQRTESRQFYKDPLAQTFVVGPGLYPNGLFISRIRVCFKTKDPTVPVTMQVRPVVNGYPDSSVIYPFGTVTLSPDKVKISEKPNLNDNNKYTDFIFDAPIHLAPGEHSFVLLANSNKYEVFCAEKGKTNLLDNKQISEQPYLGSLFLSQNGSTWTAEQNLDMMFQINRNQFDTTPALVVFTADMSNQAANVPYDVAHLMTSEVVFPGTSVTYRFASEKADPVGGLVSYKPIIPLENYILNDGEGRRVLNPTTGNGTFKLVATLATNDSALAPYIDVTRFNLLAIENRINNLPINNTNIVIANTGSGMTDGFYTLALGNTSGDGAIITANVVGGSISRAWISTSGGSRYVDTPTVNLFASGVDTSSGGAGGYTGRMCVGTNANGASILITGETSKSGGPAAARYIMRTVTLADGFDSGDLRVYLTAYKPAGSEVYVYFKPLSISDPTSFDNREWQLLTQITSTNFVSTQTDDFRELVFAPGINNIANNSILYTAAGSAFNNFKTFAVKVVMTGTDTVNVPLIKDLRVIALPEGS